MRYLAALGFLTAIITANYLTTEYGIVAVGLGLTATAGTYAAGATFILRDTIDDAWRRGVILLILLGAALSFLVADGRIAIASGAAFLISELVDLAVYRPLRRANRDRAVMVSNIAGSSVDTLLFLAIAGFPITWPVFLGQLLVKYAVSAVWISTRAVLRDPVRA